MKTKYLFLAALGAITFASCMSDEFVDTSQTIAEEGDLKPILFNSLGQGMTRADFKDAEAAKKLGEQFVVFGYKGSKTGTPGLATNGIAGGTVFDNYLVTYKENTANTTESNSDNWEYVGNNPIKHAVDNHITQQTIKYWDYSQSQYDFIAWSTGTKTAIYEGTPNPGEVLVSEIQATPATGSSTPATTGLTAAYTFKGTAEDLKECYISDLVTVYKGAAGGTYNVVSNGYQQPVTLKFRQLGTKVRIGIYETVPGYSVRDVKFYYGANVAFAKKNDTKPESSEILDTDAKANTYNATAKIFTTVDNGIYKEGTYTVYFPTVDAPTNADNNQAHIVFDAGSAAQKKIVEWGGLNYTIRESGESSEDAIYLGRTSNKASFAGDAAKNYYEVYLPNQYGTNLNLRVDYTLESIDGSSEKINVKGATAQVPLIYTQWKPGYAYTYLFKISDKTNGHTGVYDPEHPNDTYINSDPAGLYPITFDAIVVNAEDKDYTQETITLVSTPSITTYQNGSKVVNNDEYTVLTPSGKITGEIYVTVNDGTDTYDAYTPDSGDPLAGLYTESGGVYTLVTSGTYDGTGTYYKRSTPSLDASDLQDLTDKAELYVLPALPAGRELPWSEAEVIDALQLQDDDGTTATTIKGRSGLVLTEATKITTDDALTAGQWKLTNEVTYGVDGNKIDLTDGAKKKAAKFLPVASKNYAFVYEKTPSGATEPIYEPRAFAGDGTKYRYKITAITTSGDVQKNTVYVKPTSGTYTLAIEPVFLGQGTGNLYESNTGTAPTSDYAKTSTNYYYKVGGDYLPAHPVAYADFASAELYVKSGAYYVAKSDTEPVDGTAYYYKDVTDPSNVKYVYCVIKPEQTAATWYTVDTDDYEENGSILEIKDMTYFDKYIKNNAVRYAKVIKVQ